MSHFHKYQGKVQWIPPETEITLWPSTEPPATTHWFLAWIN